MKVATKQESVTPESSDAREPTPAERQRIRRRLDEVFDDSRGMYLDGESDQAIGRSLDLPWMMVRKIREAAYGPIVADEQVDKLRDDLRFAKGEVSRLQAEIDKAMQDAKLKLSDLSAKVDRALSDVSAVYKRIGM